MPRCHPTAGAIVIGARKFLVAYNVYLQTKNVEIAKKIAKAVRFSSGGLRAVKGMGVEVRGQAQVSMNLTDTDLTPMARVFRVCEARGGALRRRGAVQRNCGTGTEAGNRKCGGMVSAGGEL